MKKVDLLWAMPLLALAACRAGGSAVPRVQAQQVRPRYYNPADTAAVQPAGQLYSPSTLIIMYDGPRGKKSLLKAVKKYGARLMYDYTMVNGIAIELPKGRDVHEARAWFQKVKGVVGVNYDYIYQLDGTGPQ